MEKASCAARICVDKATLDEAAQSRGGWFRPILTTAALVLYFLLAAGAHIRACDFGRNFFLNCLGRLVLYTAALIFTLLAP